jgi:hypothetical protein
MPKINRPSTLRVAQLGMSVRRSVTLAIRDREKEFGVARAVGPDSYEPPLDGAMVAPDPFVAEPLPY